MTEMKEGSYIQSNTFKNQSYFNTSKDNKLTRVHDIDNQQGIFSKIYEMNTR